jgi:hypothetical protein
VIVADRGGSPFAAWSIDDFWFARVTVDGTVEVYRF